VAGISLGRPSRIPGREESSSVPRWNFACNALGWGMLPITPIDEMGGSATHIGYFHPPPLDSITTEWRQFWSKNRRRHNVFTSITNRSR
jgi:hypothetical protein